MEVINWSISKRDECKLEYGLHLLMWLRTRTFINVLQETLSRFTSPVAESLLKPRQSVLTRINLNLALGWSMHFSWDKQRCRCTVVAMRAMRFGISSRNHTIRFGNLVPQIYSAYCIKSATCFKTFLSIFFETDNVQIKYFTFLRFFFTLYKKNIPREFKYGKEKLQNLIFTFASLQWKKKNK